MIGLKLKKICFNHLSRRKNRILRVVFNIAQVYPAWPGNLKSLGKPRDFRFLSLAE